jgi:Tfp pilus assembly protein PilV
MLGIVGLLLRDETNLVVAVLVVAIGLLALLLVLLRLEVSQREIRKRRRTIAAPTQIPSTTHKRKPKIDVFFDSSSFKK